MTPAQRATLSALADVLIPAAHGMPAASGIGLAGAPLDRALRARPDLVAPLGALLDRLAGQDPGDAVRALAPGELDLLFVAVAGAYTLDPAVRSLLGYPGQGARTLPRAGFGAEELAAAMMEAPPRWRDPDGGGA